MNRALTTAGILSGLCLLPAYASQTARQLSFEETALRVSRVIHGTVLGPIGEVVELPDGAMVTLGVRASDGVIVTPHRISVATCFFDSSGTCPTGELEVVLPGGMYWRMMNGKRELLAMQFSGPAGLPLPAPGSEIVLFLARRGDSRLQPIADVNARLPIERSAGSPRVRLEFDSPRFLSAEGRLDPRNQRLLAASGHGTTSAALPEVPATPTKHHGAALREKKFVETVPLSRITELVDRARSGSEQHQN